MKYLVLLAVFLFAVPSWGSTVTFTDPETGEPTITKELSPDGRFSFHIQAADANPSALPTASVLITDDTGQMAAGCYPIEDGQTIAVTSEMVIAVQPIVTVTGRAYSSVDCIGGESAASNEIRVEFVPEAPGLLAPLAP